jgi:phosphatidylglycerophosphatase C
MKQGLALFDFDGTLTTKDSLLEFIRFAKGSVALYLVMGLFSPVILFYKLLKQDGEQAKRMVLSFLFKGKKNLI